MHLSLDVLKAQREEAERVYNEWLTKLDELHRLPIPYERDPSIPAALARLNDLLAAPIPAAVSYPAPDGTKPPDKVPVPGDVAREVYPPTLKGRLKEKIRVFAMRLLQVEDRFAAINRKVDWVNEAGRQRADRLESALAATPASLIARDEQVAQAFAHQREFHRQLVSFLNAYAQAYHDLAVRVHDIEEAQVRYFMTIVGLVDTKDRELNGLINNHVQKVFDHLNTVDERIRNELKNLIQNRIELLSGRLDVLLESFDRKLEKMMLQLHDSACVRDQMHRELDHELHHQVDMIRAAMAEAKQELLTRLAETSNAMLSLKRQMQGMLDAGPVAKRAAPVGAPAQTASPTSLDDYKYSNFEFRYRGSEVLIRERFGAYVDLFDGDAPVLDAGCGRGEFLELLADRKRRCYGIDINDEMVAHCREKALRAEKADLVQHLSGLADESLGGIFSAQVVEHLQPGYLLKFLELGYFKLRKGGRLVIETINPTSLYALFEAYYRDLTHVQPIHPDTLRFFAQESGFAEIEIMNRSPVSPELKLTGADENTAKLNRILFGDQDYALIARKL